jgi:hypothetical protein
MATYLYHDAVEETETDETMGELTEEEKDAAENQPPWEENEWFDRYFGERISYYEP